MTIYINITENEADQVIRKKRFEVETMSIMDFDAIEDEVQNVIRLFESRKKIVRKVLE